MKVTKNLPIELERLLIKLEEEDGGIVVSSLEYIDSDLEIYFTVSFPDSEIPHQNWRIRAINIKKERFERSWETNLQLFANHPLLLEFNDDHSELYYTGRTLHPEKLIVDLFRMFSDNAWKDLKFGWGINAPDGFLKLCNEETGLFARGPKSILEKYASVLHENGIRISMLDDMEKNRQELMLLMLGRNYFIAEEFTFDLIN